MLSIVITTLLVIHVVVSLLIVLVVLMQRPKNEGLGAAFGGGMTDNLFGAQTTNVLQKFTRLLGGSFFLLTLILSILYAKQATITKKSNIQLQLSSIPALPVAAPTPLVPAIPAASPFAPGTVTPVAPTPAPAATATMSLQGTAPAPSATVAPLIGDLPKPDASAKPSPTAATAPKDDKKQ